WQVRLMERHAIPAQEASGNHAGSFHPLVTPDDSVFARLTRAAFSNCLKRWPLLENLRWDRCGVLQLARDAKDEASQRASIAALALPAEYAQYVTREQASAHAGVPVEAAGLWFPEAGWIQPQSLVNAQLAACGERRAWMACAWSAQASTWTMRTRRRALRATPATSSAWNGSFR